MEPLIIKETQPLTEEEYGTKLHFDLSEAIQNHVRKEDQSRYDELFFSKPVITPKFEKIKVEKIKVNFAGVYNFFKSNVLEFRP